MICWSLVPSERPFSATSSTIGAEIMAKPEKTGDVERDRLARLDADGPLDRSRFPLQT